MCFAPEKRGTNVYMAGRSARVCVLGLAVLAAVGCCCPWWGTGSSKRVQEGLASWYGPDFHGKPTASGEIFNMYAYTAAHRKLPFGTLVRVTNLYNGKSVVVRINDRGPFKRKRIIDLSYAAAKKIGMVEAGVVRVRIEVIKRN